MCTKFDEFLKALGKKGKIYNNFLKIVPGGGGFCFRLVRAGYLRKAVYAKWKNSGPGLSGVV